MQPGHAAAQGSLQVRRLAVPALPWTRKIILSLLTASSARCSACSVETALSITPLKPRQHGALQILYCNFVLYCLHESSQARRSEIHCRASRSNSTTVIVVGAWRVCTCSRRRACAVTTAVVCHASASAVSGVFHRLN